MATLPRTHPLIETHRAELLALTRRRGVMDVQVFESMRRAAVHSGPEADRVLLAHRRDGRDRILVYISAERRRFDASRLVPDAVICNGPFIAVVPTVCEK